MVIPYPLYNMYSFFGIIMSYMMYFAGQLMVKLELVYLPRVT